jgi:hypothetical protein
VRLFCTETLSMLVVFIVRLQHRICFCGSSFYGKVTAQCLFFGSSFSDKVTHGICFYGKDTAQNLFYGSVSAN